MVILSCLDNHVLGKRVRESKLSGVPAVLLQGNLTNAYFSYQSLFAENLLSSRSLDTYR
jgi:hypothetical protein